MGDLVILLLPLFTFLILRLEYKLLFGPQRILKSHVLAHLGWLRHPNKDCMVKDGVESDMRLTVYENVMRHKRETSKTKDSEVGNDSAMVPGSERKEI